MARQRAAPIKRPGPKTRSGMSAVFAFSKQWKGQACRQSNFWPRLKNQILLMQLIARDVFNSLHQRWRYAAIVAGWRWPDSKLEQRSARELTGKTPGPARGTRAPVASLLSGAKYWKT